MIDFKTSARLRRRILVPERITFLLGLFPNSKKIQPQKLLRFIYMSNKFEVSLKILKRGYIISIALKRTNLRSEFIGSPESWIFRPPTYRKSYEIEPPLEFTARREPNINLTRWPQFYSVGKFELESTFWTPKQQNPIPILEHGDENTARGDSLLPSSN